MDPALRPYRKIAVYCASSNAVPGSFLELATATGQALARRGIELVYGGGSVGMMGRCADAALRAGGNVTGVITRALVDYEVSHPGLTELVVVETMHERKLRMTEAADAFFVLPGGFGTADEMFEAITWKQLRIHQKPIVLIDHEGFFQPLMRFLEGAVALKFIHPSNLGLVDVVPTLDLAFRALEAYEPPMPEPDPLWRVPSP